ncbi:MAG: hypothetical protein JNM07_07550 [Phycisphaerae bacterium]|nr:hypothetical protein [Phycisphaerae bacterium]
MDKSIPVPPQVMHAVRRWITTSVGMVMVYNSDRLDPEDRKRHVDSIVGGWRGNRGDEWQPTVRDIDNLVAATMRWVASNSTMLED